MANKYLNSCPMSLAIRKITITTRFLLSLNQMAIRIVLKSADWEMKNDECLCTADGN